MPKNSITARRNMAFAYGVSAPMFVYLAVVLLMPVGWGIYMSFTNKTIGGSPTFTGFQNYLQLLRNPYFFNAVKNTAIYTLCSILGKTAFGLVMALVLNFSFKGRNLVRALMIIPWTLPNVVAVLNWRWIFSDIGGIANYLLQSLRIVDRPLVWLGTSALAMISAVTANVWRGTPFFGISILARLQTISKNYYEAAEIDGANVLQKFRYITWPFIADVTMLTALVSTIWTINEFESVWLLTGGGPSRSTEVIGVFSYVTAMTNQQIGMGVAVSMMAMPILLILIAFVSRKMLNIEND
ncbi:MAG: sugar ABC transporter permease [Candidatus Limiplasma sp.]|nr:sugar ABC transporter permease [Candidatus Limiplasma sp.]